MYIPQAFRTGAAVLTRGDGKRAAGDESAICQRPRMATGAAVEPPAPEPTADERLMQRAAELKAGQSQR